ncbi:hypothetical protein ACFSFW_15900 [Fredinandcohnia salidurans]|uniref:Uncharacterized protein n=1 Tax=Fredinandcohnia salidurans TaxID=2595041 RepID=A0ABW4MQG5_9BACI
MELKKAIMLQNSLAEAENKVYLNAVTQLNTGMKELLTNDVGNQLVKACAIDISGHAVRKYFDMGDLYVTADQLAARIINFDYKNEIDPLGSNKEYQKEVYAYKDSEHWDIIKSKTIQTIEERDDRSQKGVFTEKRKSGNERFYDKDGNEYRTRSAYKKAEINPGQEEMKDSLTGQDAAKRTIQGDHVRSVKGATYNARYLKDSYVDEMRKVYNSEHNMQWIDGIANQSKNDAATPETTINRWEETTGSTRENLIKRGYLDPETGKVPKTVKKELEKNFKHISNTESKVALKHVNHKQVGKDAATETKNSVGKILTGQLIYYVLPPLVYEVKTLTKNKSMTLDTFFSEIKKAGKRVVSYVFSKLKKVLAGIVGNSLKKFLKTFFDIILSILKETVKRLMRVIKDVVLALVDSVKVVLDKNATGLQKADAVFNLLAVTISNVVVQLLFEYVTKQTGLPGWLMEAAELILTVLTTNIIMLILQKADLFDVSYGLLTANIEKLFEETKNTYEKNLTMIEDFSSNEIAEILDMVTYETKEIKERLATFDIHQDTVKGELEKVNKLFDMKIDFDTEWQQFIGVS